MTRVGPFSAVVLQLVHQLGRWETVVRGEVAALWAAAVAPRRVTRLGPSVQEFTARLGDCVVAHADGVAVQMWLPAPSPTLACAQVMLVSAGATATIQARGGAAVNGVTTPYNIGTNQLRLAVCDGTVWWVTA